MLVQIVLPQNVLHYKTSFLQNVLPQNVVPRNILHVSYKKRPPIQNVLPTERPSLQNVNVNNWIDIGTSYLGTYIQHIEWSKTCFLFRETEFWPHFYGYSGNFKIFCEIYYIINNSISALNFVTFSGYLYFVGLEIYQLNSNYRAKNISRQQTWQFSNNPQNLTKKINRLKVAQKMGEKKSRTTLAIHWINMCTIF